MKKILLSLFILLSIAGYSQQRLIDAKKINVRELLYSNGYDLIYPGDSTGQFDYDNVEDPVLDLDAVNLRTLRRWFANYLDTVIVGLDTFITLPPDTFLNAYGNAWLHSGQTIEHPPLDTVYVEWMQEWIGCNETIARDVDSIYIDSLNITICEGCFITTDTTQFYVRRNPCTYECWQYSYDNFQLHVVDWFCEPTPERNVYVTENSEDVLRYFNRDSYIDNNDSVGFERKARYEDKYLRFSWDSVYWDDVDNDSLFMDGVWYNLPDTLPINVDSLIYVNNVPISIGDTIFTHDSVYYNGEWVLNDTIHIVDNSITNERDSIYISNHLAWYGNRDTLNINDADYVTTNELDSIYVIERSTWYTNSDTLSISDADYNPLNEKDSIQINSTWLSNGESISIPILWTDTYNGISTTQKIGVGTNDANDNAMIYTDIQGDSIGVLIEKYGSGDYLQFKDREENEYFSVDSLGGIHSMGINYPREDGDSLQMITTDGDGNLYFSFPEMDSILNYYNDLWIGKNDTFHTGFTYVAHSCCDIGIEWGTQLAETRHVGIGGIPGTDNLKIIRNQATYPEDNYLNGHALNIISDNKGINVQVGEGFNGLSTNGSVLIGDSLIVGGSVGGYSPTKIGRTGSMAEKDIWVGTQSAYDLLNKNDHTIYFIEQNFNVLQIIFFLLLFFGSRGVFGQSNWAAVNIGTTEMKKIYVGHTLVWEKQKDSLVMTIRTISKNGSWSPSTILNTGNTLHWIASGGGISYNSYINDPTINLSTASDTVTINVYSSDYAAYLTTIVINSLGVTHVNIDGCRALETLGVLGNNLTELNTFRNTNLTSLYIAYNDISYVNINNNPLITYMSSEANNLSTINVDNLLDELIYFGKTNGTLNISSQSPPASPSITKINILKSRGWNVTY